MRWNLSSISRGSTVFLTVVIAAAWARSYFVTDWIGHIHEKSCVGVGSARGSLWWRSVNVSYGWEGCQGWYSRAPTDVVDLLRNEEDRAGGVVGALGFGWTYHVHYELGSVSGGRLIRMPYWFIWIASIATPVSCLVNEFRRRRRRRARGLCRRCGYDLRASSERCPECGARIHNAPRHGAHDARGPGFSPKLDNKTAKLKCELQADKLKLGL